MFNLIKHLFSLLILVSIITSCTSTKITATWREEDFQAKTFDTIAVVAVTDNLKVRQALEDRFTEKLIKQGIHGVPSLSFVSPDKDLHSIEKEKVISLLQDLGADGVIVINILSVDKEKTYIPGTTYYTPYYNNYYFYDYYAYSYSRIHEPGYYQESTSIYLETDLFDLETTKLIWSARSETVDPTSANSAANTLANLVISRLYKENVILKNTDQ